MSKTIYVQPPIIVKELAERIGISPYQLLYDLVNMSVFVRISQSIKPEVATFICKKYGFTLILSRHNDLRPPSSL
jgi:translation initiation factor IF-2